MCGVLEELVHLAVLGGSRELGVIVRSPAVADGNHGWNGIAGGGMDHLLKRMDNALVVAASEIDRKSGSLSYGARHGYVEHGFSIGDSRVILAIHGNVDRFWHR